MPKREDWSDAAMGEFGTKEIIASANTTAPTGHYFCAIIPTDGSIAVSAYTPIDTKTHANLTALGSISASIPVRLSAITLSSGNAIGILRKL